MPSFNPSKYKELLNFKQEDVMLIQELVRLDNEDRKDDSQRLMTWFALAGMVLYPLIVVLCDALGYETASRLISNMSDMYFVSVSAIVMAFFGANAWARTRHPKNTKPQQEINE